MRRRAREWRRRSTHATRHQRNTEIPTAPLSVSHDRQSGGNGAVETDRGGEERHDQRGLLPRPFSREAGNAGRADTGVDGTGRWLLLLLEIPDRDRKLLYLASMTDVKFRRPVVPGDQLRIEVDVLTWKGDLCKIKAKAFVDGNLTTEATMLCVMADREEPIKS